MHVYAAAVVSSHVEDEFRSQTDIIGGIDSGRLGNQSIFIMCPHREQVRVAVRSESDTPFIKHVFLARVLPEEQFPPLLIHHQPVEISRRPHLQTATGR